MNQPVAGVSLAGLPTEELAALRIMGEKTELNEPSDDKALGGQSHYPPVIKYIRKL
jgi:hypothetical protein